MVVAIGDGEGIGRKKTEHADEKKTSQGDQQKIIKNIPSLEFLVNKIISPFI
jgi:hypothetical protein